MLASLELQVSHIVALWFWSHILPFWAISCIMSGLLTHETLHLTNILLDWLVNVIAPLRTVTCVVSRLPATEAHHLAKVFLAFVAVLSIVSFISNLVVMAMVMVATSSVVMTPMLAGVMTTSFFMMVPLV